MLLIMRSVVDGKNKVGAVFADETVKWIGSIGILVLVSWAIWKIVLKAIS